MGGLTVQSGKNSTMTDVDVDNAGGVEQVWMIQATMHAEDYLRKLVSAGDKIPEVRLQQKTQHSVAAQSLSSAAALYRYEGRRPG